MTADLLTILLLLATAILMFAFNRPRADAVAVIMMTALPFTGVITVQESIAGFSNPNIVLIGAMFVIGEALARTGVAQSIGDWLATRGGDSAWRLLTMLMLAVGVLGSVMSSTGVVAMFIPVVLRIASRKGIAAGKLMMPMAYAALISGMMTLVATSPNLIINYELVRFGAEGFNFFSFTPFGVPILCASVLYMLVARRWLAKDAVADSAQQLRPKLKRWVEQYKLVEREYRVRVRPNSSLLGRTLGEMDLPNKVGARIILIERGQGRARKFLPRTANTYLAPGDVLLIDVDAPIADVDAIVAEYGVDLLPRSGRYFSDRAQDVGMVEVIIPAESQFVRKTVAEAESLVESELSMVGIRRKREAMEPHHLRERKLKVGDTVLLAGPWRTIRRLQKGARDLVVLNLPREYDEVLPAASKAPFAIATLALVITLMATGVVPNVHAALLGCVLMTAFGCIDLDSAYRSIHLKSLVMIVGMLPFALALERTGGVDMAAQGLVALVGDAGPYAILVLLFAVTVVLGLFIVNTANAVLMIPIGLAMAEALEASPYPFAMIIALAASAAFMTPISPINTLVATAGGYSFGDFIRIGLPLTLIVMVIAVFMVAWLLPLYPA